MDGGLRAVALEGHFGSRALEAVGQTASIRAASASSSAAGVNGMIDRDAPIALEARGRHCTEVYLHHRARFFRTGPRFIADVQAPEKNAIMYLTDITTAS
jgi:hypothetical protein